jgi:predicted outer membrane repeat protein
MFFPKRIRTGWSDFFEGYPSTTLVPKEYTSNQTLSGTNVYVLNCVFSKCTSTEHGGAISCKSASFMLIESSSFFTCNTSQRYGGAVYFQNSSCECVLYKVCANDCLSTNTNVSSYGQFLYTEVKNGVFVKNYVNYSSISRCVNDIPNSWYTLYLNNGKTFVTSVNISKNKCGHRSGICCWPHTNSSYITCSLSYSSFTDNRASGFNCIYFQKTIPKNEIICCNILRNSHDSITNGIIDAYGNSTIDNSCILGNRAEFTFRTYSSTYTITLTNCTIDKTATINGVLIIQSPITNVFIHTLDHLSTRNCHAEYDSLEALTSKKMYTCNVFFYQPRLVDFVSLISIFIFNFINPNPYVRP